MLSKFKILSTISTNNGYNWLINLLWVGLGVIFPIFVAIIKNSKQ